MKSGREELKRTKDEEELWRSLGKTLESLGLRGVGARIDRVPAEHFLPIDYNLDLASPKTKDGYVFATPIEFRATDVERLLDDAADLLARCSQVGSQWNDLARQAFIGGLEDAEYLDTYELHQKEIAAGTYTVPYEDSYSLGSVAETCSMASEGIA